MVPIATGRVSRLYTNTFGAWIRLDIDPKTGPKDKDFRLRLTHNNYNSLYSLALAAAANRWPLQIRIEGDVPIPDVSEAIVEYFVVDWTTNQADAD